ncbi:MAG: hypothetical protein JW778_06510 [Candidatus Altiarchaeota archaeon]|nr:hypothetical protein [Candidatus Altiarchaeota archaeon]
MEKDFIERLRESAALKRKSGESEAIGCGFIPKELEDVFLDEDGDVVVVAKKYVIKQDIKFFNLRETEELIRFLEKRG